MLNRVNPLTYAVDAMRRLVFDHLDISDAARHRLAPGVTLVGLACAIARRGGDRAGSWRGDVGGRDLSSSTEQSDLRRGSHRVEDDDWDLA